MGPNPSITHTDLLKVLLVEDNVGDARHLHLEIADTRVAKAALFPRFELTHVRTLAATIEHLQHQACDVVLLDLSLPDSSGFATFQAVQALAIDAAVIILTGSPNDHLSIETIRHGAQDYLIKGEVTGPLLARAVCYAAERRKLQVALAETQERERQHQEFSRFAKLSQTGALPISARSFGQCSLREINPDLFAELLQKYGQALDWSLEQMAYKVEHPISEEIHNLAQQLGFIGAGPRDVVDIHMTALKAKVKDTTPQRAQAYSQEGKLLAFELMGNLVSYYRIRAVGTIR
ncbi:MAG: response regulator [Candidatus Competibacteraceae bacterium]|jgi:DNA-binding NarL/FixJ family response regulator|nr:response regulator [Candidatus Competibacteraceae bacterium]